MKRMGFDMVYDCLQHVRGSMKLHVRGSMKLHVRGSMKLHVRGSMKLHVRGSMKRPCPCSMHIARGGVHASPKDVWD